MPVIKIKMRQDIGNLQNSFKQLVDDFFHASLPILGSGTGWGPAVDVCETEDALHVIVDLAGVEKDALSVVVEGNFLRISGRRYSPLEKGNRRYYQVEIEYGPFERIIRLSVLIDYSTIDARYENGLLHITLAKEKGSEPIKINITD